MYLKGTGGIPYKGYIEANLTIPGLPWYNEDVFFLVVLDHKYREKVPIQIGTQAIDCLVMIKTEEELQQAGDTRKQIHLSTVISKRNTVESLNIPEYNLEGMKGKIHMMREVVILPFAIIVVKGIVNLMMHSKYVNIIVEPIMGCSNHIAMARSYGVLRLGRGKISVCLQNHSMKQITIPEKTAM